MELNTKPTSSLTATSTVLGASTRAPLDEDLSQRRDHIGQQLLPWGKGSLKVQSELSLSVAQ